ncbi:MAG: HEAT repeat domain-containing protein [Armatimonadetes bacterium]|nr:HEAT repeat domain-containing protein [Armatimonadota bacterium]
MTPRKYIGWGVLALFVLGIGNFAVGNLQTRGSLGKVEKGGAEADTGVRELMARNVLFDALQGGAAPKTRLNAIASLTASAKTGKNPESFTQLLQMLKDPDTEMIQEKTHPVRDAATAAVASVGTLYPDLLLDAAKNADGAIRDQSRAALTTIGAPLQTQMAARLEDAALRSPVGGILAGIGADTVGLVTPYLSPEALAKFKDKPDDLVAAKLQLIEIMGKYTVTDAATAVLPFENDPEPNVRRAVITALANIADPVGEPVLRKALANPETDASSRAAAAATLGAFGTVPANDAMVTALGDFDLAVADAAATGLGRAIKTNEATARVAIERALASPDAAVRARAASATAAMTNPDLAKQALADTDAEVRMAGATALGAILTRRGVGAIMPADAAPLIAALRDSTGAVAAAAQQALVSVGAPVVPAVAALLSDPQDTTAYYAVRTLSAIGAPSLPVLLTTAQAGKPGARWAAVTLGEIGDVSATPVLESLKNAPDAATAEAATDALAKIGG